MNGCPDTCPHLGKCLACTRSEVKRGIVLRCKAGDRRGPHTRCFTCQKADRCKRRKAQ